MLKELRKIFDYYKKKYKLKTRLSLNNNERCAFNYNKNYISYDINYVAIISNKIIDKYNVNHKLIFCLLHELGHAIDKKYNKKQVDKEKDKMSYILYNFDVEYALSLPFEKRANKFAKKELKKWIN